MFIRFQKINSPFTRKIFFLLLTLLSQHRLISQGKAVSTFNSHKYYVKLLENSKDSLYEASIYLYNSHIAKNPKDYVTRIELCKFIENAYYDESEDYNPKYDEWINKLDSLMLDFPDVPEVLLYKSETVYGDSAIAFCERILSRKDLYEDKWKNKDLWMVYQKLAQQYDNKETAQKAIKYALRARELNDTLDNSVLLAKQYKYLSQNDKAVNCLLSNIDTNDAGWALNQKGKLLLELGKPDKALYLFKLAKKDSNVWLDDGELSRALLENGFYEEAREYLVKDIKASYNKKNALNALFKFDLEYCKGDSASISYRKLVETDFMTDLFGIKRIRLFIKDPSQPFSWYDLARMLLLLLLILCIVVVPYLWILPIYTVSKYYKYRGMLLHPLPFRWTLRHFWMICSLILFVDVLNELIFDYDRFLGIETKEITLISLESANMGLFSFLGYLVTTLLVVKRSDLAHFWGKTWTKKQTILKALGAIFLMRVGLGIYASILKIVSGSSLETSSLLSINDTIVSINQFYHPMLGFLFVVLIGPVYEEFLFRGVILSATEKYMRFALANTFQAALFAAIHLDLKLFPFYFVFGFVTGYYRNKAQSLAPGIVIHTINNLIAFIAITSRA